MSALSSYYPSASVSAAIVSSCSYSATCVSSFREVAEAAEPRDVFDFLFPFAAPVRFFSFTSGEIGAINLLVLCFAYANPMKMIEAVPTRTRKTLIVGLSWAYRLLPSGVDDGSSGMFYLSFRDYECF